MMVMVGVVGVVGVRKYQAKVSSCLFALYLLLATSNPESTFLKLKPLKYWWNGGMCTKERGSIKKDRVNA